MRFEFEYLSEEDQVDSFAEQKPLVKKLVKVYVEINAE
jgi:hypothetical protein